MICAILRQFFQNFETICNPSLYGVLSNVKVCATELYVYSTSQTFPREKQVCVGGLENVCESDADWGEKPPVSFSAADGRF